MPVWRLRPEPPGGSGPGPDAERPVLPGPVPVPRRPLGPQVPVIGCAGTCLPGARRRGHGARASCWPSCRSHWPGLLAAAAGLVVQLLPRPFSAAQKQQIIAWEMGSAGAPGRPPRSSLTLRYQLPGTALGGAAACPWPRTGSGSPARPLRQRIDPAAARILPGHGCLAVLRATYVDATRSLAVTVGVAVMPSPAAAALRRTPCRPARERPAARRAGGPVPPHARGPLRRAGSASCLVQRAGPYLVLPRSATPTAGGGCRARQRVRDGRDVQPGQRGRRQGGRATSGPPRRHRRARTGQRATAAHAHGGRAAGRAAGGAARGRPLAGAGPRRRRALRGHGAPGPGGRVRDQQMWVLDMVDAPAAWPVTQGQGVLVAVIDSGVLPDPSPTWPARSPRAPISAASNTPQPTPPGASTAPGWPR